MNGLDPINDPNYIDSLDPRNDWRNGWFGYDQGSYLYGWFGSS